MSRFATALYGRVIGLVLGSGTALTSTPAEAAKMSPADKVALKQAVAGCKGMARGKNIKWWRWIARRNYINACVTEALKERPNTLRLIKYNPNLPMDEWDQPVEFKRSRR
jgi:hypothetical protein